MIFWSGYSCLPYIAAYERSQMKPTTRVYCRYWKWGVQLRRDSTAVAWNKDSEQNQDSGVFQIRSLRSSMSHILYVSSLGGAIHATQVLVRNNQFSGGGLWIQEVPPSPSRSTKLRTTSSFWIRWCSACMWRVRRKLFDLQYMIQWWLGRDNYRILRQRMWWLGHENFFAIHSGNINTKHRIDTYKFLITLVRSANIPLFAQLVTYRSYCLFLR